MSKKIGNLELLLFLLENTKDISDMTEMKVYKLLYFLDKEYFLKFGKNIAKGMTRNTYGPVISGLREVKNFSDFIQLQTKKNKSFYSLKDKDFVLPFSEEQRKTLLGALERYKRLKASELVTLSHNEAPYLMAEVGENLNFKNLQYNDFLEDSHTQEKIVIDFSEEEKQKIQSNLIAKYG